jgi:hypothetical protein
MKKNNLKIYRVLFFLAFTVLLFSMVSCATTKQYPYFITRVQSGGQNEWVKEEISDAENNGIIYTQFVPLTATRAAFVTVGNINNMLVSQIIIPITPGSIINTVNLAFFELENVEFDIRMRPLNLYDNAIYISILEPTKLIKALQQPQTYNANIMFDMTNHRCRINGNLELF